MGFFDLSQHLTTLATTQTTVETAKECSKNMLSIGGDVGVILHLLLWALTFWHVIAFVECLQHLKGLRLLLTFATKLPNTETLKGHSDGGKKTWEEKLYLWKLAFVSKHIVSWRNLKVMKTEFWATISYYFHHHFCVHRVLCATTQHSFFILIS